MSDFTFAGLASKAGRIDCNRDGFASKRSGEVEVEEEKRSVRLRRFIPDRPSPLFRLSWAAPYLQPFCLFIHR